MTNIDIKFLERRITALKDTTPLSDKDEKRYTGGDDGGDDGDMNERLARLEERTAWLRADVDNLRGDVRDLKGDVKDFREETKVGFRWVIGMQITMLLSLIAALVTILVKLIK